MGQNAVERWFWGIFVECWRRGLKVNANKSKVMLLDGVEGLECKSVWMECVLAESGKNVAK